MAEFTVSEMAQYVGKELGVSSWATVDQSRINQFAKCSGDHQWIHVDVERAKRESPYKAPIAHGEGSSKPALVAESLVLITPRKSG